jgi:5-methyltetrahydrofolate--homocysteine methyltransferase
MKGNPMSALLEHFKKMIVEKNRAEVNALLPTLSKDHALPEIFSDAVYPAMNEVRQLFKDRRIGIPELLLSLDLVRQTLETLSQSSAPSERNHHILLGVIEGDIHDMGKNIVRATYQGYGFQVTDLGKNIPVDHFLDKIRMEKPDLVGISTMMSTTVDKLKSAIESIKKENSGIKVMVGGAFINREIAVKVGADGYAESAATLIEETESVLAG